MLARQRPKPGVYNLAIGKRCDIVVVADGGQERGVLYADVSIEDAYPYCSAAAVLSPNRWYYMLTPGPRLPGDSFPLDELHEIEDVLVDGSNKRFFLAPNTVADTYEALWMDQDND